MLLVDHVGLNSQQFSTALRRLELVCVSFKGLFPAVHCIGESKKIMPFTTDCPEPSPSRLDMTLDLLQTSSIQTARGPRGLRRLQIPKLISDVVVTLKSASIEMPTRDRNRDVTVYWDCHRSLECFFSLALENSGQPLATPAALPVVPEERRA